MTVRPRNRTVRELVYRHHGKPAVVLGGGLSLPRELQGVPTRPDAIWISANDHGARSHDVDYICAHDKIEPKLRPFGKPIISRHMYADFRIMGSIVPDTGAESAWLARLLGCAPIYICGCDLYQEGIYYDQPDAFSTGAELPLATLLSRWRKLMTAFPGPYVFQGGPLLKASPQWDFYRPEPPPEEQLIEEASGKLIELLQPHNVAGQDLEPGLYELIPYECQTLIRKGVARWPT